MHFITLVVGAAAFVNLSAAVAVPAKSKYVLHEKREAHGYSAPLHKRSKIDVNQMLSIRIGLAQSDLHKGYDYLMDVSDPKSANYGKHWSAADVNKAFAPSVESVESVRDWLVEAGIAADRLTFSDNRGWLKFEAAVEEAEQLFQAQYYQHDHKDPNKYSVGCDEYYLPEHIQPHVDYITPGVKHHVYKRQASDTLEKHSATSYLRRPPPPVTPPAVPATIDAKTIPLNCSNYVVDADCIRALYQLPKPDSSKSVNPTNALGIFEAGENYSPADLKAFFESFAPQIPPNTMPEVSSIDGGEGPVPQSQGGGEAILDVTVAYALVWPQTINVLSVDDSYWSHDYSLPGFGDTLLDALDGSFCTYSAFGQKGNNDSVDPTYPDPHAGGYKGPLQCGVFEPPKVISFSYGEPEQLLPVNYVERQCQEYLKLALQGTTAIFAAGDTGVEPDPGTFNETDGCLNGNLFSPTTWSVCPYTLAVGATQIKPDTSGYNSNPEMPVYIGSTADGGTPYTSGGGFSNVFARPSYQDDAVEGFFKSSVAPDYPFYKTTKGKNLGENGGIYNRAGRAYPDCATNGAWWNVYTQGSLGRTGGSSMSAPLMASIINILNEERLRAGKSTVGFVNPTFYAHPEAFHDLTEGSNQGCGYDHAFNATLGWDPVSGLGTPNFAKLKEIFLSLP